MSLQLICGDTCQIWMWFKGSNLYFNQSRTFAKRWIQIRDQVAPHARQNLVAHQILILTSINLNDCYLIHDKASSKPMMTQSTPQFGSLCCEVKKSWFEKKNVSLAWIAIVLMVPCHLQPQYWNFIIIMVIKTLNSACIRLCLFISKSIFPITAWGHFKCLIN